MTAAEIQAVLSAGDDDRASEVRAYERGHKHRAAILADLRSHGCSGGQPS